MLVKQGAVSAAVMLCMFLGPLSIADEVESTHAKAKAEDVTEISPGVDVTAEKPPEGWIVVVQKNITLWCTPRPATGTRLPGRRTCMTPDQARESIAQSQALVRDIQRHPQKVEP